MHRCQVCPVVSAVLFFSWACPFGSLRCGIKTLPLAQLRSCPFRTSLAFVPNATGTFLAHAIKCSYHRLRECSKYILFSLLRQAPAGIFLDGRDGSRPRILACLVIPPSLGRYVRQTKILQRHDRASSCALHKIFYRCNARRNSLYARSLVAHANAQSYRGHGVPLSTQAPPALMSFVSPKKKEARVASRGEPSHFFLPFGETMLASPWWARR